MVRPLTADGVGPHPDIDGAAVSGQAGDSARKVGDLNAVINVIASWSGAHGEPVLLHPSTAAPGKGDRGGGQRRAVRWAGQFGYAHDFAGLIRITRVTTCVERSHPIAVVCPTDRVGIDIGFDGVGIGVGIGVGVAIGAGNCCNLDKRSSCPYLPFDLEAVFVSGVVGPGQSDLGSVRFRGPSHSG